MSAPYERDLAHEADMRELHREQLRNDVEDEASDEELDDYYAERVKRRRRLLGKPA